MRIKHWQGYGCVNAKKVKDASCTLHIRVEGNHEWGIVREDEYDVFKWLVKKFDNNFKDKDWVDFHHLHPVMTVTPGYSNGVETADYRFIY